LLLKEVTYLLSLPDLIRQIKIDEYKKTKMLSAIIPKKTTTPNTLRPVLPLIAEKGTTVEDDKTRFITTIELRARVNAPTGSATYKKYIKKFEEGTAQEWIDLQRDIQEIWVQNTITGGTDRASTARALLCGESLTSFEAALEEARRNDDEEDGALLQIDAVMVDTALTAVATTVFPHGALEIQRLWMNRGMRKPYELTTRKTAAAITRINNALPLFPGGTDASKFSNAEVIGLLEWSTTLSEVQIRSRRIYSDVGHKSQVDRKL
jgi:hypothetical protein